MYRTLDEHVSGRYPPATLSDDVRGRDGGEELPHLTQLADANTYRPCDWDLKQDAGGRAYWVAHFCHHLDLMTAHVADQYPDAPAEQIERFRAEYLAMMRALEADPDRHERIDVLLMDELRHDLLVQYGFADPFRDIKRRENDAALAVLPRLLAELDAAPPDERVEKLARGLLAGNLFDMGAPAAVERYRSQGLDFWRLRDTLPPRPWFIDHLDHWRRRWANGRPYRHALLFADNTGPDICLGCLPLVRWLLQAGTRVTLAANSAPALNDVTANELVDLLNRVQPLDETLADALPRKQLSVIPTGSRAPLIDLSRLTPECVESSADADLVILIGMGRAVESNYHAHFTCDALRVAVLKDEAIAARVGGKLFNCIFRYEAVD